MKIKLHLFALICLVGSSLSACGSKINPEEPINSDALNEDLSTELIEELEQEVDTLQEVDNEVAFAMFVYQELVNGTFEIDSCVEQELLFSPYAYILSETPRLSVADLKNNTQKISWGIYDGKGTPIELTVTDYMERYVGGVNPQNSEIFVYQNEKIPSRGNEKNNIADYFDHAIVVEFYKAPSEPGFMDWNSIYFVIEQNINQYVIKAVIHNQWTV